jgi:isoprenylcysteine carboxyl methyltransferase (ICMT) family protein YpbQ
MFIAYCVLAVVYSVTLIFSGIFKLQHHPQAVQIIHELIGVPLGLFPVLAACEFAGAAGLLAGIRWAGLGIAAAVGLVIYFVGAMISHMLAADFAGLGSPGYMLVIALVLLGIRIKTRARPALRPK